MLKKAKKQGPNTSETLRALTEGVLDEYEVRGLGPPNLAYVAERLMEILNGDRNLGKEKILVRSDYLRNSLTTIKSPFRVTSNGKVVWKSHTWRSQR